jgi:protoporphyrinogen oxidase
MNHWASRSWGVVGGGILGMAIADGLARAGHRVTLLEAAETVGGLAISWQLDDIVWDRHYHVTLASDTRLRALLAELGLEREMRWVRTRTGFFKAGRLYSLSNAMEFLRFPLLSLVDKLRLAATLAYAARVVDWRPLEHVTALEWLSRLCGRRVVETIWRPLLRAKLGDAHDEVSAAFIWTSAVRLYAARRDRFKRELFGHVPGGYARILARLTERLLGEGVDVRTAFTVGAVDVCQAGFVVAGTCGRTLRFDNVVVTAPGPVAAAICRPIAEEERSRLANLRYQGIVCASLLMRRPLGGFYLTNIGEPGVPLTAVIEMTTLVDPDELGGHSLVYLPRYVNPKDPLMDAPEGEIRRVFLEALAVIFPDVRDEDVLAFRVSRVRHVFAVPALGYSERLPPMATSVPGLFTVNSAHIVNGTLNVNETLLLADRATALMLAPRVEGGGGRRVAEVRR